MSPPARQRPAGKPGTASDHQLRNVRSGPDGSE
jgi:hypothetical protein